MGFRRLFSFPANILSSMRIVYLHRLDLTSDSDLGLKKLLATNPSGRQK
jgi:hypothetical protein